MDNASREILGLNTLTKRLYSLLTVIVFLVPGFTSTDPEIDGGALFSQHLQTHYHQPSDDLSRPIDWGSALRFARANVRIGHAIAEKDARPQWNEGDFFGEKFDR